MPFKPGESGNPGGKTKNTGRKERQIREILLPHVQTAVEALLRSCQGDNPVPAAKEIIERVFGKTPQAIEMGDKNGMPLIPAVYFVAKPPPTDDK